MLPAGRTLRARRFAPVQLAPLGSIYDIQCAVAEKATGPIYYEIRRRFFAWICEVRGDS